METQTEILKRNQSEWEIRILQGEAKQLKRERDHLKSKAEQRPLSRWEELRLEQIFDEITEVVTNLTNKLLRRGNDLRQAS